MTQSEQERDDSAMIAKSFKVASGCCSPGGGVWHGRITAATWVRKGEQMNISRLLASAVTAAVLTSAAHASVLYSNGAVVNANGQSILDGSETTYGFTSSTAYPDSVADDFTVSGASWDVGSFDVYAYQTQATSASLFTFTGVKWSIVKGSDVNTGAVIASGTSAVTNAGLVGYRVLSSTLSDKERAIFDINADIPDVTLGAGHYFLTWSLTGTGGSGPYVPPVIGSFGAGNALQSLGGAYTTVEDGYTGDTAELPFALNVAAAAVPEPASWAMMIGGFGLVGSALRRKRQTAIAAA